MTARMSARAILDMGTSDRSTDPVWVLDGRLGGDA